MSGTNKAILSMCVLLLAAMVVYYGMTPPPHQSGNFDLPTDTQSGGFVTEDSSVTSEPVISGKMMDFLTVLSEPTVEDADETDEVANLEVIENKNSVVVKVEEFQLYTVTEGDSLSRIAVKILDKESRWRELQDWNNIEDEDVGDLRIGQVIKYIPNPSTIQGE